MPPGSRERERRSWALRRPVPGLASDKRGGGKVVSDSVARVLERTGREGQRWERKPHPPGQKPEGGRGRRPLGLGGARPTRFSVGRKEHRTTHGEEEGRHPGLGKLRTQEAGEGSSARSHGWALGQYEGGWKK